MMRARFTGITNWDHPSAGDAWQPHDPESFRVYLTAWIGSDGDPRGDKGVDAFDFIACTPDQLAAVYEDVKRDAARSHPAPEVLSLPALFVLKRWDATAIEAKLTQLCEQVSGDSWEDIGAQLNDSLDWEFLYRLSSEWR